jgi:hypothetical protein
MKDLQQILMEMGIVIFVNNTSKDYRIKTRYCCNLGMH